MLKPITSIIYHISALLIRLMCLVQLCRPPLSLHDKGHYIYSNGCGEIVRFQIPSEKR